MKILKKESRKQKRKEKGEVEKKERTSAKRSPIRMDVRCAQPRGR